MQIQAIQSLAPITGPSGGQGPLDAYSPGDVIAAEVAEAEPGRVVLRLPQGGLLEAGQRTMDPLQEGDQVLLLLAPQAEGETAPRLELLSVNGQPVKAGASPQEYALLRMRVPPTPANLALAVALGQIGAPLRPETFARMGELGARFPGLAGDAAVLLAASSLPLNGETVEAFTGWLQAPATAAGFAAAAKALAALDPQAAARLEAAARQMEAAAPREAAPGVGGQAQGPGPASLPQGLSPSLAAKLTQSGVWEELRAALPTLPEAEAQGRILQLLTDLPPETTGRERAALHAALLQMRAAPAGEPQAAPQAPQAPQAQQAPGAPEARQTAQAPGNPQPPEGQAPLPPLAGQAPLGQAPAQEALSLPRALSALFAALGEALPGEQGQALREAAAGLGPRIRAFTGALEGREDAAGPIRPILSMGQALTAQVQMGGELGNLLYVPLPFSLRETQQDAALYVLKRDGGRGRVDEANVTVAICLDTQNLGPVDSLLRVERSELSLQFRVETPAARSFLQARLARVAKLSFPAQYRFKGAGVVLRGAPMSPVNAGQIMQRAFGIPAPGGLDITI